MAHAASLLPTTDITYRSLEVNAGNLAGQSFFRTMFYMPSMIPVVAAGLIWAGVMRPRAT